MHPAQPRLNRHSEIGRVMAIALALAGVSTSLLQGQDAPPVVQDYSDAARQELPSNPSSLAPTAPPLYQTPSDKPLFWGPLTFHPHALYRYLYGNGMLSAPGRTGSTSVQNVAPGVFILAGRHLSLDYTPTWSFYSSDDFRDTLAHSVLLRDTTTYEDLTLDFSQTYNSSSEPLIETGRQTSIQEYVTKLDAIYQFGGILGLETNFVQDVRFTDGSPTTREWTLSEGLNYRVINGVIAAAGLGVGYVAVDPGPNMEYLRPELRVSWQIAGKLLLHAHGGLEERKYLGANSHKRGQPVYGLSFDYHLTDTTLFTAEARRSVGVSYFVDEVTENDTWALQLNQRLFENFSFILGYEHTDLTFLTSRGTVGKVRDDESYAINARLSATIRRHLIASLIYQNTHNNSSAEDFEFSSHQYGVELSYRY
ncbi:MAG TPA: hypothetical protein VFT72_15870 [Opitutaceae bacterium]|nr:hypothetical protein [Opitutaceae bacterium]